jgi:hypothetical protein
MDAQRVGANLILMTDALQTPVLMADALSNANLILMTNGCAKLTAFLVSDVSFGDQRFSMPV